MAQFAFKSLFQKSPLNLSDFDLESGLLRYNTSIPGVSSLGVQGAVLSLL